jgi:hypothetical protein
LPLDSWTEAKASNSHTRRRKTKREVREVAIIAVIADGGIRVWGQFKQKQSSVVFFNSVADPGCLSRILCPSRIPNLGSRISDPGSRIPDPKRETKERGEKK